MGARHRVRAAGYLSRQVPVMGACFFYGSTALKAKKGGRRRGPEKMPMAALRLPCRTFVLSASPPLALDIFQARLARKALAGDFGRERFCWFASGVEKLRGPSLKGRLRPETTYSQ